LRLLHNIVRHKQPELHYSARHEGSGKWLDRIRRIPVTTNLLSRQRRSETPADQRAVRPQERVSMPGGNWSTPLWAHALPAWRGNGLAHDLTSEAELAYKHDAVRRWRGLPSGD
jgi:hypothetical protein